ncbi:MAG: AAA family ATPase [bacterium]|nr:AAA family ATPase [bacterium]
MKVVALVGLPGSGKSEASRSFEAEGFSRVRFGDATEDELKKRNLEINEKNEKHIRELLRKELGMDAYAKLNVPKLDAALEKGNVVADGLYSWEEYLFLKEKYNDNLVVVAIYASPKTRYERLGKREIRPLTADEAKSRDYAEIQNINKGGPIAIADYTINNESSLEELEKNTKELINSI